MSEVLRLSVERRTIPGRETRVTVIVEVGGERMSSGEASKRFLKKVVYKTKLPYITITPTYSVCSDHGYIPGSTSPAQSAGGKPEVYSRVVGYYRPVRFRNAGKREEFRLRLEYDERLALSKNF